MKKTTRDGQKDRQPDEQGEAPDVTKSKVLSKD